MTRIQLSLFGAIVLTLASLSGCARSETPAGTLRITEAWARSTPPGAEVGVVYAVLRNDASRPLKLSHVESDAAASADIHDMTMEGGMMRMRPLEGGLSLEPGETVSLKPGGKHLMLMGLRHPLTAGDTLKLTFRLSDGSSIPVDVPVRGEAP